MEWVTLALDVLAVIGGSAVIAATPLAKVVAYIPLAKKILDTVACNVGEAKNQKQ